MKARVSSETAVLFAILKFEFTDRVIECLLQEETPIDAQSLSHDGICDKVDIDSEYAEGFESAWEAVDEINDDGEWPVAVPDQVKLLCMHNYRNALKLRPPKTCGCCGRRRLGVEVECVRLTRSDMWMLEPLRYSAVFPDFPWGVDEFAFESSVLDGFMLEREGIQSMGPSEAEVYLCEACFSDLKKERVPRYSYANHLYRGRLPECFRDLTVGEEMICSRFKSTAYIYRLKGCNSDDQAPLVMSGNCCAHELNTVSTANILPRTPADVRDLLTVVFIGSGKFDFSKMGANSVFRVRKRKVLEFLQWLSVHNPAYKDVTISLENLNQYPEDGTLTGLEESVIVQSTPGASEGVGFEPHVSDEFLKECTTADI
ncbi:hypothetical protein V5O48_008922 [Marasmius crinis-equi]|uniref:DUF6570 domain-containing protein n=1 Tax=Marasmius crinis-equi TaxID=585013 RepID=A0ABR3FD73_9AGAR